MAGSLLHLSKPKIILKRAVGWSCQITLSLIPKSYLLFHLPTHTAIASAGILEGAAVAYSCSPNSWQKALTRDIPSLCTRNGDKEGVGVAI